MTHAAYRASERLRAAGIDPQQVLGEAERIATHYAHTEIAVRLRTLPATYGDEAPDILSRESNGDEVWMVARGGYVKTVMLRRSTQPHTPEAFGVRAVYRLEVK